MTNWSELVHDLLILISNRLTSYEDLIAFRCVCTSWKAAATKESYTNKFPQVPWLLLPEKEDNGLREFFILSKHKIHTVILPEPSQKWCLSSLGWLLTVAKDEVIVHLLHPLSRVRIQLPKLTTFKFYQYYLGYKVHYISKFVLSSSPSLTSDYLVMVVWGCLGQLGFCRQVDNHWIAIDTWDAQIFDIAYYEGKLYAVDSVGRVLVCDVNDPNPRLDLAISSNGFFGCKERLYVVELSGKLLIVSREGVKARKTIGFRVFELNLMDGKLFEIRDLGSKAIFLGYNSSFSVEACERNGCKGNCIYFTDDNFGRNVHESNTSGGNLDMGIYNLLDGRIDTLFNGKSCSRITPSMWVQPSF